MHEKRMQAEEMLRDLKRAQDAANALREKLDVAARTAARGEFGSELFVRPLQHAAAEANAAWWQITGHVAMVEAELAKLPPLRPEDMPVLSHVRHA